MTSFRGLKLYVDFWQIAAIDAASGALNHYGILAIILNFGLPTYRIFVVAETHTLIPTAIYRFTNTGASQVCCALLTRSNHWISRIAILMV